MQLDLSSIESAVSGIGACTATIQEGVAALKAAHDPTAQARVDAVGAILSQHKDALQAVADSLADAPLDTPPVPDPPVNP